MSDEHKPHDDAHSDTHSDTPADTHGQDHPAETPATPELASEATAEVEAAPGEDSSPEAETVAVEPEAVAASEFVDEAPAEPEAHAEPETAAEPVTADEALAAGGIAAAAAAASAPLASTAKRPVWSDQGDAPFEDVDSTPVYADRKKTKKTKGAGNETLEIIKTIVFALLIALVLRTLAFQPFTIPSASMEPNLYEGDYIVVSKWSYGYSKHSILGSPPVFDGRIMAKEPKRGDIVVFKLPRDNRTDYIKRLIGLPGDRIQMIDNVLHINGQPVRDVEVSRQDAANMYGLPVIQLRETFPDGSKTFTIQDFGPGNAYDDTPVFEIPAGHYFMMGDNRDNSTDSRVDESGGVGLVPAENLIGKAEIIMFSWEPGASLWNPVSWFSKVRLSRFFKILD